MTVNETVSTNGGYKVFSSALNADITTSISEVINELETHKISMSQIQFQLVSDGQSTPKYMLLAICKGS